MSRIALAALAAVIVGAGTAYAAGGDTHFAVGPAFTVNPITCKLQPRETDTGAGSTLASLRRFVQREDEIHDRVMGCLKRRHTAYTRVHVTGSTHDVTATCPAGSHVVGGGFDGGEAEASYPSSPRSWTVTRAHDNKPAGPGGGGTLTAFAVCATVVG